MGCNSSKQEDIRVDRERQRRQNTRKPANKPQTSNQTGNQTINQNTNSLEEPLRSGASDIGSSSFSSQNNQSNNQTNNQSNPEDDSIYGTSYTNRRAKEFDLLNQIIKQTRENFIDVSAKVQTLDDEDRNERSTLYAKTIKQTNNQSNNQANNQSSQSTSQSTRHSVVNVQPTQSLSITSLQSLVDIIRVAREQSTNQSNNQTMITEAAKGMSDAILNVSITQPEPFVLTFEELIARQTKRPMTNQQQQSNNQSNNQFTRTVQIA